MFPGIAPRRSGTRHERSHWRDRDDGKPLKKGPSLVQSYARQNTGPPSSWILAPSSSTDY
jgi:hypothetical protein